MGFVISEPALLQARAPCSRSLPLAPMCHCCPLLPLTHSPLLLWHHVPAALVALVLQLGTAWCQSGQLAGGQGENQGNGCGRLGEGAVSRHTRRRVRASALGPVLAGPRVKQQKSRAQAATTILCILLMYHAPWCLSALHCASPWLFTCYTAHLDAPCYP